MNQNPFEQYRHVHFIGIGGIGVSAIARMFQLQGKQVSGSDMSQSEITDDLVRAGMSVSIGHQADNIDSSVDLVVHTIAIPETNLELSYAHEHGVRVMTYPEVLGELSKTMFTIAIAGTHGKTTTTAMIAHMMEEAGLKPTVIVGSKLIGKDSNFVAGAGTYLVVEACEYKRSFLNLYPNILVITNIEADHLDYYKDLADIQDAFSTLAQRVPQDGYVVSDLASPSVTPIMSAIAGQVIDYKQTDQKIILSVPGAHNRDNAQAAWAVGALLNIDEQVRRRALQDFKGTWRRLEYKGVISDMPVYDDYAHHPTAIRVGLAALKEMYPDRKIVCVFEPHQQQRVKNLMTDFVHALSRADRVFIAPIYKAREVLDSTVSHTILARKIEGAQAIDTAQELKAALLALPNKNKTVVVMMGAGYMHDWVRTIMKEDSLM